MTKTSRSPALSPALMWMGFVLTVLWEVAMRISLSIDMPGVRPFYLRPFSFGAALAVANGITLWLSVKVQRDFPRGSDTRRAWRFMAWAAVFQIVRYGMMWYSIDRGPGGLPLVTPGAQAAGLIATLLLLGALLTMRSPFIRLGLGRLRWTDWTAVSALLAAVPVLFLLRQNAPAHPLRAHLIERLQWFDPLLIVGCAIAGVIFLRISRDLEGGSLAVSFRYFMMFGMARLLSLLALLLPIGSFVVPFTAVSLASDWFIAMAVFYRWRLTTQSTEMARTQLARDSAS